LTVKVTKIALGVVCAALMTACETNEKPATAVSTTANSTDAAVEAIVYVNSDSLLSNYEYFKEARTRLQGKTQKAEQDLRNKAEAFQNEVNRYQQSAQTMTPQQRQATEQRLAQKQQQLAGLQQQEGGKLATEESEEMKKIYDKVEAYLQRISSEKGYKMVLSYSRGNSAILYGDNSLDITQEVLDGLNERYKVEQDSVKAATKK
jgi:outer membrane protein